MKRCSTLLVIREMKIKTTMRYHLMLTRMTIILKSINNKCCRGCGEKKISYTISGNVNWYRHYGKQLRRFLKTLKTELPYDLAIPLLRLYPEKMKTLTQRETCTSVFVTSLFMVARAWKQLKYPSTDEWIEMYTHAKIHTMEYYSVTKRIK